MNELMLVVMVAIVAMVAVVCVCTVAWVVAVRLLLAAIMESSALLTWLKIS